MESGLSLKKEKIEEAYEYCRRIKELGYVLFVNFVGTDLYSDKEFIEGIEKFNELQPFGVSIVDSFGLIKRKHFLRLVYLADNNLNRISFSAIMRTIICSRQWAMRKPWWR